eukprot:scaffold389626_cov34-Prasinocladus_malaysianus.AAC.1
MQEKNIAKTSQLGCCAYPSYTAEMNAQLTLLMKIHAISCKKSPSTCCSEPEGSQQRFLFLKVQMSVSAGKN